MSCGLEDKPQEVKDDSRACESSQKDRRNQASIPGEEIHDVQLGKIKAHAAASQKHHPGSEGVET